MPSNSISLSTLNGTLTSNPSTWRNSSLISVSQISTSGIVLLFNTASAMRELVRSHGGDNRLNNRILASVFYEASTRTSCSFQAAMLRLGGKFIHVDGGASGNTSASKKGESLDDTIRSLECYTDLTVLRHPSTGSVENVALGGGTVKPVINAGDGVGEHPTQALLDMFTIWDELGLTLNSEEGDLLHSSEANHRINKLVVVLLGDLKHGRTVHSLAKLLARSSMNQEMVLRYCSPPSLVMPSDVKEYVHTFSNVKQEEYLDIEEAIQGANVLYVTRIQKERFEVTDDYEKVKGAYVVDMKLLELAPGNMIIMHPLPRVDEISTEVDSDPRACYFRQMENGMYVRMALLSLILCSAKDHSCRS